jgi:O-antigen biosynthesis protein WbqP
MNNSDNLTGSVSDNGGFVPDKGFRRYSVVKRIIDIICSILALAVGAIPMLIIAIIVKATSDGTVIFSQPRIGRYSKEFKCLKFRTMYKHAPSSCATASLHEADSLITPIGHILRKTSLDELPQIINVLKGEMSFIGPRPLIPEEGDIHKAREKAGIYMLRPGISGYAQVHGRDFVSARQKVALDSYYLHHFSLGTDIRVFFDTIKGVLAAKDIHEGEVTDKTQSA